MYRKKLWKKLQLDILAAGLAFLLFVKTGWCGQGVGKALDEALKSRATGTAEEVTRQFQNASNKPATLGKKLPFCLCWPNT